MAGLGLVLLALVMGTLLVEGMSRPPVPPDIAIAVQGIAPQPNGFLVRIKAINHGETTAAQVKIEGNLMLGNEPVETSELTLDFVPDGSEREGGLFFTRDPRAHTLTVRATGYAEP